MDRATRRIRQKLSSGIAVLVVTLVCTLPVAAQEHKLKSADSYFRARNYFEAHKLYREVFLDAKKGPLSERALIGMVKSVYRLKRYQEARLNAQRFLSMYPKSGSIDEVYLALGYIALYTQKIDEAQRSFEKIGASHADEAFIGTAEVALRRDDTAGAESLIAKVSKKAAETNPRALMVRAMVHSRKGQHREALTLMNKILEPTLKDEDLRPDKAIVLYNASRFAEAERLCKSIMSNPVSNMEKRRATRLLARVYEGYGNVDEALRLNLEILPYEQADDFKMNLVRLYDRKGDRGNALRYLTLLHDKKVKAAEIEKRLSAALAAKNPKEVEYFVRYSGHLDQDSPFIVEAARYLIANGRKPEGFMLLRKAERGLARGDAALYHAELLINDGKYSEAKRLLTPLVLDSRYFVRSSYLLSEVLKREGDYGQAVAVLEKAMQHTKDHRVSAALAELYATTGDRKGALKYYLSASEKGDALAMVKAADLFYLGGDHGKAQQYYKRALASDLSDPKTIQWIYYQYGKLTGDRKLLKKAAASGGIVGEAAKIVAGEGEP